MIRTIRKMDSQHVRIDNTIDTMNNTESTTATTKRFIRPIRLRREEQEGSKKGHQEGGGMVKKSVEDDCGARAFRRLRAIPASVRVENSPIGLAVMRRFDWLFDGLVRLVDCCEVNENVGAAHLFRRIISVIVIQFSLKLHIESWVFPQGSGRTS